MDGCTMVKESVFAAILMGKLLRSIAKEKFYQDVVVHASDQLDVVLEDIAIIRIV